LARRRAGGDSHYRGCSKDEAPLAATAILWIFWTLWHLQAFFYLHDLSVVPGLLFGLFAGAIIFTWIYNGSGGSILMVAVWHSLFNFATACLACKSGVLAPAVSAVVIAWAVILVQLAQRGSVPPLQKGA